MVKNLTKTKKHLNILKSELVKLKFFRCKPMTYKTIKGLKTTEKFETTKEIVEISCERCDYDRGILRFSSYASVGSVHCNNPNCEHLIEQI